MPADLEDLLEYLEPHFLGYDATIHSQDCYTIILLTLDYRYTAWRAHRSIIGRWTLSPLDASATFQLVIPEESWPE